MWPAVSSYPIVWVFNLWSVWLGWNRLSLWGYSCHYPSLPPEQTPPMQWSIIHCTTCPVDNFYHLTSCLSGSPAVWAFHILCSPELAVLGKGGMGGICLRWCILHRCHILDWQIDLSRCKICICCCCHHPLFLCNVIRLLIYKRQYHTRFVWWNTCKKI